MTKQVELKVVSSSEFAKMINETVAESNGTINHLEAVQEFLEQNEEIEPETIASLISMVLFLRTIPQCMEAVYSQTQKSRWKYPTPIFSTIMPLSGVEVFIWKAFPFRGTPL